MLFEKITRRCLLTLDGGGKDSSRQASVMIHALKLEYNIGRSVPAYMLMANNLNPRMDEFFNILGYDE